MANIPGYPNNMSKESHKWFPKFTGNNVVIVEEHIDAIVVAMEDNDIEHEDVVMKLLDSSLDEDANKWFKNIQRQNQIMKRLMNLDFREAIFFSKASFY
jgi:hypothetical protein